VDNKHAIAGLTNTMASLLSNIEVDIYIYRYVCIHVCIYICMYVCIYVCIYKGVEYVNIEAVDKLLKRHKKQSAVCVCVK
jgi:hypothetical protein